ncbi:Uncharacterised protein [Mycobacteroides abscessus subsp. abscessus]|nr:hypothetical protein MMAS_27660 [Mycobacteroides abscessus subsp. massiliense CCUG 48898 = JCM 15300]CPU35788.1 Uncharacterised protein [Mycobacteroides abscessus]SIM35106.1 Uncharacterised protein [Mycobacteroides abscessus subsp. abscessus]SLJ06592.1 Uncharacterised protein [Mycobacteroides abscessus subsp. massiliense]EIV63990.1 hypothetical protein MMCCUG48898_2895 [Mycobacteroides abscessus subsp. massiliense CCUG 48898 = JCM 15300]
MPEPRDTHTIASLEASTGLRAEIDDFPNYFVSRDHVMAVDR